MRVLSHNRQRNITAGSWTLTPSWHSAPPSVWYIIDSTNLPPPPSLLLYKNRCWQDVFAEYLWITAAVIWVLKTNEGLSALTDDMSGLHSPTDPNVRLCGSPPPPEIRAIGNDWSLLLRLGGGCVLDCEVPPVPVESACSSLHAAHAGAVQHHSAVLSGFSCRLTGKGQEEKWGDAGEGLWLHVCSCSSQSQVCCGISPVGLLICPLLFRWKIY